MPISPLPEATVQQLGATLAITSPVIVVKELVENALDAGATSIGVFISSNTIDRIEVRDNGPGIASQDFDALGRPGYTSKLQSLDDLARVGGRSYGFRGIALASIVNQADVLVATRTHEQPVSSVLRIMKKGGGVEKVATKAAPIGTIVCVTKLFFSTPVRIRIVAKESLKAILGIQTLLESYVMVKPQVKMMFRILDSTQQPWAYTPKANSQVKEAVTQLFGVDVASRCRLFTSSNLSLGSPPTNIGENPDARRGVDSSVDFQALVQGPDSSSQKKTGIFLSVDSRPISSTRGIGKKILKLFRKHIHSSILPSETPVRQADPFIQLNLKCSDGSYDVNVEPTKDDVLFADEEHILNQLDQFLSHIYRPAPETVVLSPSPIVQTLHPGTQLAQTRALVGVYNSASDMGAC
ncbi:histidine kinase-like ATPase [Echria macrotheca]|uniref:Histidine kinase-like ATPase n=1 Tax=Echria macrotheca TaxID=438768 RepID=A0AAJ0BGI1_9PEZI|nr:histidine kinase-like ATPase [Echria macrotheca]